ncbi:MAG: class I SAM-dependent methyltransferase [Bacteroidota bacterium]
MKSPSAKKEPIVKGATGYSEVVKRFVQVTEEIPFNTLHQDFLRFFPNEKSLILDAGAGTGRDAYTFSLEGHSVLAVEPLAEFRAAGKERYASDRITWMDDSLPELKKLGDYTGNIDFILCSGVWHHLNETEQKQGLTRISELLKTGGVFALSLRNGPAGAGTHVFPVRLRHILEWAHACAFEPLMILEHQPSLMEGKEEVTWARLVLKKT